MALHGAQRGNTRKEVEAAATRSRLTGSGQLSFGSRLCMWAGLAVGVALLPPVRDRARSGKPAGVVHGLFGAARLAYIVHRLVQLLGPACNAERPGPRLESIDTVVFVVGVTVVQNATACCWPTGCR